MFVGSIPNDTLLIVLLFYVHLFCLRFNSNVAYYTEVAKTPPALTVQPPPPLPQVCSCPPMDIYTEEPIAA